MERSRLKCGQYWPLYDQSVEEYGEFIVMNNGIHAETDYTVTSLILQNIKVMDRVLYSARSLKSILCAESS